MPENHLIQLVAFDVISEEAWLQVIVLSFEVRRSSLYRFFFVSFLGFLLICGAVAFGFFTVSDVFGSKLSESYKNQSRNSNFLTVCWQLTLGICVQAKGTSAGYLCWNTSISNQADI